HFLDMLEAYDRALAAGRRAETVDDRAIAEDLKPKVQRALACLELLEAAWPRARSDTPRTDAGELIPDTTDLPAPALPKQIGRYRVIKVLGRGGMGVVYLAHDPELKRLVAVKMLRGAEFASAQELSRFRTEAQAVARLRHANIVQIHEIGEHHGH